MTGFATGMIAGALWLVFFIGLGLTARNSPGHPFKSIKRFRSSSRGLDLDVPSALQAPQTQSEVKLINTTSPDRPSRDRTGIPEPPRQVRPVLRSVPNPSDPAMQMQIDPASFFDPESSFSAPPASSRRQRPEPQEPAYLRPTLVHNGEPALVSAAAGRDTRTAALNGVGYPGSAPGSRMTASAGPPGPPERPGSSRPGSYSSSESSGSYAPTPNRSGPPTIPPTPPAALSEAPPGKSGRGDKKSRKSEKQAKKAAGAAPPPPIAASPAKPEKKGMFKRAGKDAGQAARPVPSPAPPPPSAAGRPVPGPPAATASPARPRFNPPFNYTPPGSSPGMGKPSYPTVSPNYSSSRSLWQPPGSSKPAPPVVTPSNLSQPTSVNPPASFNPPSSPSFSHWGPGTGSGSVEPKAADRPEPEPRNTVAPEERRHAAEPEVPGQEPEAPSPWNFDLSGAASGGNGTPEHRDPVLPEVIDLSMFRDPTTADGDDGSESDATREAGAHEDDGASWMADEAWPAPVAGPERDAAATAPRSEETVMMEPPWLQEEAEPSPVADWTSPATPWPGETRRPSEPSWADEPPAAASRASRQTSPEHDGFAEPPVPAGAGTSPDPFPDPWPQAGGGHTPAWSMTNGASPVQPDPRTAEPQGDPWSEKRSRWGRGRRAAGEAPADDPWRSARAQRGRRAPEPPPPDDPWAQLPASDPPASEAWADPQRQSTAAPVEDPWVMERGQRESSLPRPAAPSQRPAEDPWETERQLRAEAERQAVQPAAAPPVDDRPAAASRDGATDAWTRANPDVDEEDWKPMSFDISLEDEAPARPEVTRNIAKRLKVEPTAIKVESGLAYVLVDDEGRPVLK
ncbi:MAG TPA: hypothetical protein VHJ78_13130 [Actinomycetota bacterium]|nr:hypothetical protein [Actinomycetota bacterium]